MRRVHTRERGWNDLAQHLTIDPEGVIWTGRSWNLPPVSAAGHNGNRHTGPLLVMLVGDFDREGDRLEGQQHRSLVGALAALLKYFALPVAAVRFPHELSALEPAIRGFDYDGIRKEVGRVSSPEKQTASRETPLLPADARAEAFEAREALAVLHARGLPACDEPGEAQLLTADISLEAALAMAGVPEAATASRGGGGDDGTITPAVLGALRPHVINLNQGNFSTSGSFSTGREDVDAIFEDHLPRWEAEAGGAPLRLAIFAHGGLVSEEDGLKIADNHVRWWKENRVYPIYFVWETGLWETIGQLLSGGQRALGARGIITDHVTDPALEGTARLLGGPRIWGGMKRSAELASTGDGGARYAAAKLKEFCDRREGRVELHAVGHSAGSIFHSWFIPAALAARTPPFKTLHFLAPAITVGAFKDLLLDTLGQGVEKLSIFTMRKDLERADQCMWVYRKSLLYLIRNALEREDPEEILGLEESLRRDRDLVRVFGLDGEPAAAGEVVWSQTEGGPRSSSLSATHGGFDDDPATMNSVLRRILGRDDIIEFTPAPAARAAFAPPAWLFPAAEGRRIEEDSGPVRLRGPAAVPMTPDAVAAIGPPAAGRRKALCVGINSYPTAPLEGCVADAEEWAQTLGELGFEVRRLVEAEATRAGILTALEDLIRMSRSGDVLVFQYAGHGTQLTDIDGDEAGGDSPGQDEAMVPYDFAGGAYVIDDDLARVFSDLPDGVNLTCFTDCCHSGTITRLVGGGLRAAASPGARRRFLPPTLAMNEAHARFRQSQPESRGFAARDDRPPQREVHFSACRSIESAWESNGHGDFTRLTVPLLRGGFGGLSHEQFMARVLAAFGPNPRQVPELHCGAALKGLSLLAPFDARAAGAVPAGSAAANGQPSLSASASSRQALAQLLQALADFARSQ